MSFIIGILMIALAVHLIVKTESWLSGFGRIAFFERHLGTEGGSRLGYKLLGILIFFIAMLIITGMFEGFMLFILGPLLRLNQ